MVGAIHDGSYTLYPPAMLFDIAYCDKEWGRSLLLYLWRAKTLNQPLNLISAAAASHCGIGLFFNCSHCCRAIDDGIDNVHLENLITGT